MAATKTKQVSGCVLWRLMLPAPTVQPFLDFDHGHRRGTVDYPEFSTLTGESQLGFSAWTFIALLLAMAWASVVIFAGRLTKVSCALPSVH